MCYSKIIVTYNYFFSLFFTGVRALLIDKDKKPKWSPSTLEDVKNEVIDKYFEPLPNDKELQL